MKNAQEEFQLKNANCKLQIANRRVFKGSHMSQITQADISDRLLEFAARIGRTVDALTDTRMGRHIAGQLVRSGTSPAPNYAEACAAESRKDFVHKLSICLKELRESGCWIQMIIKAGLLTHEQMSSIQDECEQLCNIIGKSIVTAKSNNLKPAKRIPK